MVKAFVCVILAIGCAACDGSNSVLAPTGPSPTTAAAALADTPVTPAPPSLPVSRVPPISVPDGVSCPSDAPVVLVTSTGTRLEIDWSPIPRITGSHVAIEKFDGKVWAQTDTVYVAVANVEWYGTMGTRYRVRVRSARCGDVGVWSPYFEHTLDSSSSPQPPPPTGPKPPDTKPPDSKPKPPDPKPDPPRDSCHHSTGKCSDHDDDDKKDDDHDRDDKKKDDDRDRKNKRR